MVLKNDDWRPVHQRRGFDHCEYTFKGYPVLRKYLAEVTFLEHIEHNPAPPENSWIGFESDGGFYDPETSIEALRTVINKKIADYGRPHKKEHLNKHNLSELYLLVYADPETFWHNTPYQTINQALISPFEGLQSVAMNAAQGFIEAPTVFAGVFLFYPLWRESRLLSICPRT